MTENFILTYCRFVEQSESDEDQRDPEVGGEYRCHDRLPALAILLVLLGTHRHRLLLRQQITLIAIHFINQYD